VLGQNRSEHARDSQDYNRRRHGSHGFTTGISVFLKSPTFRETIVKLWWIAVAASKPSMADKGLPLIFATAAIKPQRSATAASIDRILPEKRACSSTSSHVSRRLRRLPCGSAAKPFRISIKPHYCWYRRPRLRLSPRVKRLPNPLRSSSPTKTVGTATRNAVREVGSGFWT
jgi:hypothetical protein